MSISAMAGLRRKILLNSSFMAVMSIIWNEQNLSSPHPSLQQYLHRFGPSWDVELPNIFPTALSLAKNLAIANGLNLIRRKSDS
ncbi:hypothetical protein AAC387_Pa06g1700 [Persea americana]